MTDTKPAERTSITALQELFANKQIVEAHFERRNSGGYTARVLGHPAFMPGSHSLVPASVLDEQDPLPGTSASVTILDLQVTPFKLVVSRRLARDLEAVKAAAEKAERQRTRDAAAAELAARRAEEITRVNVGDIIEATVSFTRPPYAYLQAGSLAVRVPKVELAWGEVDYPEPGTITPCVVTAVDVKTAMLAGSIRLALPDPWSGIDERYQPSQTVIARVKSVVKFGVFAEVELGVDCLVHRSHIPGAIEATELGQHFNAGDMIPILISSVDASQRRMGAHFPLSLAHWKLMRSLQHQLLAEQHRAVQLSLQVRELTQQQQVETEKSAQLLLDNEQTRLNLQQQLQERTTLHEALIREELVLHEVAGKLREELQQHKEKLREGVALQEQQQLSNRRLEEELSNTRARLENELSALNKKLENDASLTKQLQTKVATLQAAADKDAARIKTLETELEARKRVPSSVSVVPRVATPDSLEMTSDQGASLPARESVALSNTKPADVNEVFITFSNSKQLVAALDLSRENLKGEIFPTPFPHFNRLEQQQLLSYQQLCQFPNQYLSSLANRVRSTKSNMLFANKPPAFHKSHKCQFALSDYVNYEVPEEIKSSGREEEFREWWAKKFEEKPGYRDNPLLMESLLTTCQLKFKLARLPRQVVMRNGGIVSLDSKNIALLESQIQSLITEAAEFVNSSANHRALLTTHGTHAYKGHKANIEIENPTNLVESQVKEILRRYDNDYKKTLITLLQTYYRSKYNDSLAFDHSLLIAFGFRPCHGCFGHNADRELSKQSHNPAPPISSDEDNDLPF